MPVRHARSMYLALGTEFRHLTETHRSFIFNNVQRMSGVCPKNATNCRERDRNFYDGPSSQIGDRRRRSPIFFASLGPMGDQVLIRSAAVQYTDQHSLPTRPQDTQTIVTHSYSNTHYAHALNTRHTHKRSINIALKAGP